MEITIFNNKDLKKNGSFKLKNNSIKMNKEEFFKYLLENNLNLTKGYIDNIGFISNGLMFKCNCNGFIIGVTKLIIEHNSIKMGVLKK